MRATMPRRYCPKRAAALAAEDFVLVISTQGVLQHVCFHELTPLFQRDLSLFVFGALVCDNEDLAELAIWR